jgi:putative acetyltransferase
LNFPSDVGWRLERPGDEGQIRAVVEDAFRHHPIVATLVDRLRESPDWIDGLSFVAETEDRIVGHILLTRGLLDAPRRLVEVLVLSQVAVATAFQGRGIGSALIRGGLAQDRGRSEPLVFLEGSPTFYGRFGFQAAGELGFRRPSLRIPQAAFQVIKLPRYEPWMTGTLVYSRVFWDLDVDLRGPTKGRFRATGIRIAPP